MVVASGYLEADSEGDVERVKQGLAERNIGVEGVTGERIVYIIERDQSGQVRSELEGLKDIPGVRGVYLAYFSVEGADEETPVPGKIH